MNVPVPVDELPSFIEKNQSVSKPLVNPMLTSVLIGIAIMSVLIFSVASIPKKQNNNIDKMDEE